MNHSAIHLKLTQHCKANILQLKKEKEKRRTYFILMYFLCTGLGAKKPVLIQIIGSITQSGRLSFLVCKVKRKYLPGSPETPPRHMFRHYWWCAYCVTPLFLGLGMQQRTIQRRMLFFLPPGSWHSGGSLPECSLNCRALRTVKEFLLFRLWWVWPECYRWELSHSGSLSNGGPERREVSFNSVQTLVICRRNRAHLELWQSQEEQKSSGRIVTKFPLTQPQSSSQEQTGPVCDFGRLETVILLGETFLHSVFGSLLSLSLCSFLKPGSSGLLWCSND